MVDDRSRRARLRRRSVTVPILFVLACVLTATAPVLLPVAVAVDAVRLRRHFPIARLSAFAWMWSWIELGGVARAFGAWIVGRAGDAPTQYRLMSWWASALMRALELTIGIRPQVVGVDALAGGNAVVLSRHASLADSLLSAWAIRVQAELDPRYVLKRELLADPCLDIVGLRIPNHFLDRDAPDGDAELAALRQLGATIAAGSVGVIFTEGTRANAAKRARALERIAERDPERATRLRPLRHLLPPRPGGSRAFVEGAPHADVVLAWHTGFDGLDSIRGMLGRLARPLPPVRFVVRRVPRAEVPAGDEFDRWLDEQWLLMDGEVDAALTGAR